MTEVNGNKGCFPQICFQKILAFTLRLRRILLREPLPTFRFTVQ